MGPSCLGGLRMVFETRPPIIMCCSCHRPGGRWVQLRGLTFQLYQGSTLRRSVLSLLTLPQGAGGAAFPVKQSCWATAWYIISYRLTASF